jgi:hypothetical protein
MGSGTVRDAVIEDLQSLLAINRRRQSSPSSPKKAWIFFAAMSSAAASAGLSPYGAAPAKPLDLPLVLGAELFQLLLPFQRQH